MFFGNLFFGIAPFLNRTSDAVYTTLSGTGFNYNFQFSLTIDKSNLLLLIFYLPQELNRPAPLRRKTNNPHLW